VLVPYSGFPVVFRASEEQMIAQTEVILSDTLRLPTLPKAPSRPGFKQAWGHMCKDLLDGQHFGSVDEAEAYFRTGADRLPILARTAVLSALERLRRNAAVAVGRREQR
jgi:hypothetical protein